MLTPTGNVSEAESLDAVLEQFPADAFSCIGIVAIRNDLRDEAIRRLGDVARLPEWARLTGLFIFDEGPKSIAALTAFAKRSHGGKVYFDTQNHRSSAHLGRYAVIRALDAVGRVLANRYAAAGISTEYTRGVDFLLECGDPDFWKPP